MALRNHQKLIRTKIPEIIREKGDTCQVRTISGSELTHALIKKVEEEMAEMASASTPEDIASELADIREVMDAIEKHTSSRGLVSQEVTDQFAHVHKAMETMSALIKDFDVDAIQKAKREERGGFLLENGEGIFLEWAMDQES